LDGIKNLLRQQLFSVEVAVTRKTVASMSKPRQISERTLKFRVALPPKLLTGKELTIENHS
jgi:hypothetical protein